MKNNSIIRGVFNYSISTWINLVVGFLSVIITTRLLAPDTYGLISLFYSFTTVLMYVLLFGIDGAFIRFYNEPPIGNTQNQLLYKNIVLASIICIIAGFVCTFIFDKSISESIFGFYSRVLVGSVFVFTYAQIILRYLNISFRMSFKVKEYTIQNVLINTLSKILVIAVAFFTNSFLFIVAVLAIGMFFLVTYYLIFQRKEYIPITEKGTHDYRLNFSHYGSYFKFALFSAPTYIVTYLNGYLSNQIIGSYINNYALGIFASTNMFSQILTAMKGGFSTYWSAYVFKNYNIEFVKINKMHNYVVLFSIFATSSLILFRDVLYLFIGSQFHESKSFFSILLISPIMFFLLETTDKGIAIAKKNEINATTHIVSVAINIVLCLLLIPKFSLLGAAWANAISGIVLYALNTLLGQKYYRSIPNIWKSIVGVTMVLLILSIPSAVSDIMKLCFIVTFIDLLSICVFYKEFIFIINKIKSYIKER